MGPERGVLQALPVPQEQLALRAHPVPQEKMEMYILLVLLKILVIPHLTL